MDTEEEADQESPHCDESEIEDSERSSSSETESSDLDEETIDSRKTEYVADGHELEQAFQLVKNLLYEEKMKKIESKLIDLKDETAPEYLQPVKVLNEKLERKLKVALIRKDLRLDLIKVQFDSESLAAHQNVENEKRVVYDAVKGELEDKIRRLEEDRQNIDINSDLWESQSLPKKSRLRKGVKTITREKKKKPVLVSSPYIIYMLQDLEIIEDWTLIKKAVKQKQQHLKRLKTVSSSFSQGSPKDKYTGSPKDKYTGSPKDKYSVICRDGRLFYQGQHYGTGHHIVIDNNQDTPEHACITSVSKTELMVRKSDGNKSKLYIAQLEKGKYTIRHSAHSHRS